MRHTWLVTLALAAALVTSGCSREPAGSAPATLKNYNFGGDFALTDQDNRPFALEGLRGKVVLLFFGYTSCPDMCPTTMSRIMTALTELDHRRADVVTVFVSVDPERDTVPVLKEYVSSFGVPLIGLTGTQDELAEVASRYHASFEIVPNDTPNYVVNHTTAVFLIDRQGRLRHYFAYDEQPARIASTLRAVLDAE